MVRACALVWLMERGMHGLRATNRGVRVSWARARRWGRPTMRAGKEKGDHACQVLVEMSERSLSWEVNPTKEVVGKLELGGESNKRGGGRALVRLVCVRWRAVP